MIYFLRAGDDGPVKIGWTKDGKTLARRIATLQTGQPHKLAILRTLEAQRWVEGWLHGFFAGVRMAGEWFAYREDMLAIEPPAQKPSDGFPLQRPMTAAELRAWRAYRKWTQRELANALGMSVSRIVDYEHGESRTDGRDATIPRVVELALEALAARERDNSPAE